MDRRCPLGPETVEAIQASVRQRPQPRNEADLGLVFLTKYGQRWVRTKRSRKIAPGQTEGKFIALDSITQELTKVINWRSPRS